MRIYTDLDAFGEVVHPVVTMGTFDGLHIGHQKIINDLIKTAKEEKGETVVITFDPHPRIVLQLDNKNLKFINTQEEKIELLHKFGIDHLIIIPFTEEFSKMSSTEFIQKILVHKIKTRTLIIGYDHHFGNKRKGNYKHLNELGELYRFRVKEIPAQLIDEIAVSSTKIRDSLIEGNVRKANSYLDYPFSIFGKVTAGSQIGKTIGFPTANISMENPYKLVPNKGVYAVKALLRGQYFNGMLNIGVRPTLHKDQQETIELHIFNFTDEIYEEFITVYFYDRLRDEQKFESLELLKHQLAKDQKDAKKILSS
ncbi:bifunctional riboflavin kinase/FAD synthetase [candidate division KSB1 bacterium]